MIFFFLKSNPYTGLKLLMLLKFIFLNLQFLPQFNPNLSE